jgi:hypothetical protein
VFLFAAVMEWNFTGSNSILCYILFCFVVLLCGWILCNSGRSIRDLLKMRDAGELSNCAITLLLFEDSIGRSEQYVVADGGRRDVYG